MTEILYPAIFYKDGGEFQRPGGTYACLAVADREAGETALKEGWFPTLPEAISGELAPIVQEEPEEKKPKRRRKAKEPEPVPVEKPELSVEDEDDF